MASSTLSPDPPAPMKRTGFVAAVHAVTAVQRLEEGAERGRQQMMIGAEQSLERGKIDLAMAKRWEVLVAQFEDGVKELRRAEAEQLYAQEKADAKQTRWSVRLQMQRATLEKAEDERRLFLDYFQTKDFRALLSLCDFGGRDIKRKAALKRKEQKRHEARPQGDASRTSLSSTDETLLSNWLGSGGTGSASLTLTSSHVLSGVVTPRAHRLQELQQLARTPEPQQLLIAPRGATPNPGRRTPARGVLRRQRSRQRARTPCDRPGKLNTPRSQQRVMTRCLDPAVAVYTKPAQRSATSVAYQAVLQNSFGNTRTHCTSASASGTEGAVEPLALGYHGYGDGPASITGGYEGEESAQPVQTNAQLRLPDITGTKSDDEAAARGRDAYEVWRRGYTLNAMAADSSRRILGSYYYELMLYGPAKLWPRRRVLNMRVTFASKRAVQRLLVRYWSALGRYRRRMHGKKRTKAGTPSTALVTSVGSVGTSALALPSAAQRRGNAGAATWKMLLDWGHASQRSQDPPRWPENQDPLRLPPHDPQRTYVAHLEARHREALAQTERAAGLANLELQLRPEREHKELMRRKWSRFHDKVAKTYAPSKDCTRRGSTHVTWPLRRYSTAASVH
eukprot:TRINITY_DN28176_c0_g1_i1.p1 TRINITY_DN28176_c0_g1~~TRINITY_DN28176_c0_g1_i1.p1  ORF type:complete len:637 (+),score=134.30 TRINITY_DN28176_c0_g1_i1:50-1912(+)